MTVDKKRQPQLDELIQYITLHKPNPLVLQGQLLPFALVVAAWFYLWVFVYGVDEYWEAGLVSLAVIGCLQILLCLCCFWSVHVQTFLNMRKVGHNLFKYSISHSVIIFPYFFCRSKNLDRVSLQKLCPHQTMDLQSWFESKRSTLTERQCIG